VKEIMRLGSKSPAGKRSCRRFIWEYIRTALDFVSQLYTLCAFHSRRGFGTTAEL